MMVQIGLAFVGLFAGGVIASGVVAFIISLGIVPRYAGITKTADKVRLYENCAMAGAFLGNLVWIYRIPLPVGEVGLTICGLMFGVFLGSWIIALGEVVNIYAIVVRRVGLTVGIGVVILAMVFGKTLGSLLFFWKGWF